MATSSQAFATIQALRGLLILRAGLTGVPVYTAHPGAKLPPEAITMLNFDATQEWAALGRGSREEGFRIACSVYKSLPGASETVVQELQDRVAAIVAEVEAQIKSDVTLGGNVRTSKVAEMRAEQGFGANERWCEVTFEIECAVRIT